MTSPTGTSEKKGFQKYFGPFFQYLFSPILILIIGGLLNNKVSEAKEELQKIEIAQRMLIDIFKEEDPVKGMAMVRLMEKVFDDKELYDELSGIMRNYYTTRIDRSLESGHAEDADLILSAAENIGGYEASRLIESIRKDTFKSKKIENYREAKKAEREAYTEVIKGDYENAIRKFDKADSIYPDYKQVHRISNLMKEKLPELDNQQVQNEVDEEVIREYSNEAPPDLVDQLKTKSRRTK